jgi:hypothetical protein
LGTCAQAISTRFSRVHDPDTVTVFVTSTHWSGVRATVVGVSADRKKFRAR